MLSPAVAVRRGPMVFAVLGQGLSTGLGFAALGFALYAAGPAWPAAALFGGFGGVCGVASAVLRLVRDGVPPPLPVPLPADELASLLRSTLAEAQRQRRATRGGSPADRQPLAAADALAEAPSASAAPLLPPLPTRLPTPAPDGPVPVSAGALAGQRRTASAVEA